MKMSVITSITEGELTDFLSAYNLGKLQSYQGIAEGTVNTNYLLNINHQKYIFTVFEVLNKETAEHYLTLTEFLSKQALSCATPLLDNHQNSIRYIQGKPACLVSFLPGKSNPHPSPENCRQIGLYLAKMHINSHSFKPLSNPMGREWRTEHASKIFAKLPINDQKLLQTGLNIQQRIHWDLLPKSTIHYDLFRDNAFFEKDQLTGVIDFYYACFDVMLLDLAIAINDWCTNWQDKKLKISPAHFHALLNSYQAIRPLEKIEQQEFLLFLQLMSFHFWLTRTVSQHCPPTGESITLKDPNEFKQIFKNWLSINSLKI